MQQTSTPSALNQKSWNLEHILDDLHEHGFAVVNEVYATEYIQSLVQECWSHLAEFRAAGVHNGVVSHIRRDHILWIGEQQPIAQQHIYALEQLSQILNQAFYLGIKQVEAHFACYKAGEFYALHRDNPQQKNDRMISTVFYLHQHWQADWGGQLRLQDKQGQWHIIEPTPNRLVIFQSDLLHEVLLSKQQRLSITAWLRSGNDIWIN